MFSALPDLVPFKSSWKGDVWTDGTGISVALSENANANIAMGSNTWLGPTRFHCALEGSATARVMMTPVAGGLGAFVPEQQNFTFDGDGNAEITGALSDQPLFQVDDQAELALVAYPNAGVALPAFFRGQYLYQKGAQAAVTLSPAFTAMKSALHLGTMQEAKP